MTKKWTLKELLDPKGCPAWPDYKAAGDDYERLVAERESFIEQQDSLKDEISHARVLARRGLPCESWPKEHPARDAWLSVHRERVRSAVKKINEAEDDFQALEALGRELSIAAGLCCSASTEIPRDQTVCMKVERGADGLPKSLDTRASAGSWDVKHTKVVGS